MQRKKILHLISGLEIGGTETQLLRILPELQKYHENMVCCVRGHGPIGSELEKNGVPVYYLDFKGIYDLSVIKRFYSVVKKLNPDILVTYLIHADLYGRVFGRLFSIKRIVSSKRGSLLQWEWLSFFDRMTKFMVTHYLVQTETAKIKWMKKLKLPENKFTVMPNGIDTRSFQISINKKKKKEEVKVRQDSFIITCVARLRMGKGHETLLAAFEEIFKRHPAIDLLLVGDGEREDELRKQITNYVSGDNVHFLGNRNDVPEILTISDLFVLPTEGEGMSNAIMEAMSAGLPIITTDIAENKDLLKRNETGLLFPARDISLLVKNIELLMKDNSLRNTLKQEAQKTANNLFDYQKIASRFAEFYEKL